MQIGLAIKLFFKVLGDHAFARDLTAWLDKRTDTVSQEKPATGPHRTDAIELLAALQREGRLVDFLQENLENYSDAQIGAAARNIHRDCRKALDRMFGPVPLVSQEEGSEIGLPSEIDPGEWKLTGQVTATAAKGKLCHHGWKITRHDLPAWTGRDTSAWVIAPAEVEIA